MAPQTETFIKRYNRLVASDFDPSTLSEKIVNPVGAKTHKPKAQLKRRSVPPPSASKAKSAKKAATSPDGGEPSFDRFPLTRIVLNEKQVKYLNRQLAKVPDPSYIQQCYMAKQVGVDVTTFRMWRQQVEKDKQKEEEEQEEVEIEEVEEEEEDNLRTVKRFDIDYDDEMAEDNEMLISISQEEEALSNVQGHMVIERDNAEDDYFSNGGGGKEDKNGNNDVECYDID